MRSIFAIALLFALSGCAITEQQALALTKRDLAKRQLPLPAGYRVEVADREILIMHEDTGYGEAFPAYVITYRAGSRELYEFTVRKYTPYMREFQDKRNYVSTSVRSHP